MAYGLTLEGFVAKTLPIIREGIEEILQGFYGISIDVSDRSVEGKFSGITSEAAALIWELGEAVYASQDPDKATGQALDALCALTGTFRRQASHSAVTLTLTGTPTTPVPTGSLAQTESTENQFETLEDGEIEALDAWLPTTAYAIDARVTNADNAYVCITTGVSDVTGPETTDEDITDGTVHWRFMGEGTGAVDVDGAAVETGPIVAFSGDINIIASPLGGWTGVINLLDATEGEDLMTDEDLRLLREEELAQPGTSPIDAIRAAVQGVATVTAATVFVNNGESVNAEGMPGHSVEVLVRGGADQDIFDVLLANVAAGIQTHGTVSGTSTDSQGTAHIMKFSRPVEIEVYVDVTLVKDPAEYPVDGDDQVKEAIVAYGDLQDTGKDAVAWGIGAALDGVPGILNVTQLFIGIAPAPVSSATIPVSNRQLAVFDTSRVAVTSSDGTP